MFAPPWTTPQTARKGAAQTLLYSMVRVKLVRLAVKSPCCSFLSPLWFADFWPSVTHEGHENQRLPHLRWPRKPPLSSLTVPQHCCTAGLSTKRREALYGMGPSPDPQPAPCLTVGRLAAENSLHCSPLPSAADLDKGSFIRLRREGCVGSKAPYSRREKGRAA